MVIKLESRAIIILLLLVGPIQMWIDNSNAIESTITIQPSIEDTFVNNMYLQHKYPEQPHGYFWAMFAGNMYTEYDSFKGYGSSRIYIKFDTTSIPSDAKIISADLCLYMYDSPKTNQEFEAYRVLSEWNEHNLTWINQPDFTEKSSSMTAIQPTPSAKWICWEITEDVRMWHSGAAHNYGTMIRIKNEVNASDQVASFYPSETLQENQLAPKLTIKIDWHKEIESKTTTDMPSPTKEQLSTTEKQPTISPTDSPSANITRTDIKNNENQRIDYLLPIVFVLGISALIASMIFRRRKTYIKNEILKKRRHKPRSK
ncbi:MAG: DNRLRE domain-containing protein [Candidatus Bathyarchaeia archaeon]